MFGMAKDCGKRRNAFTLIELLVVVAIIGLLATVSVIVFSDVRKSARDSKRISDIHAIQRALDNYIQEYGAPPYPAGSGYGRGAVSPGFWDNMWDISTNPANGGFMSFLVGRGLGKVPVDPLNTPAGYNGQPTDPSLNAYVYFIAHASNGYQGGNCTGGRESVYLLGITNLETDTRPAQKFAGSGCNCLWTNMPNFFQQFFDYVSCGYF
jgi:prepilin-type N-terminal cleavage/methylation domain-containing protein